MMPTARAFCALTLALLGMPVVWTWLGVGLASVTFSEVPAQQLWRGGGVLAASAAALLAVPVALVPDRWRSIAAGGLVAAVNLVALADALHLRFFGTVVPVIASAATGQLGQVGGSIGALMHLIDGWLFAGTAVALLFALLWHRRRRDEAAPARARRLVWAVGASLALAASVPAALALWAGMNDPAVSEQLFSHAVLLGRWGLVNVHLFAARAAERAGATPGFGVARGDNLILIQVESL